MSTTRAGIIAFAAAVAIAGGASFAAVRAGAVPAAVPGGVSRNVPLPASMPDPCPHAQPVPSALRLPAVVPNGEPIAIEQTMLAYLRTYRYRELGWCVDKRVRDTGPYRHGQYYGTHPAVRIYYSQEVMAWMRHGRRGVPADGAVIIKEQYAPPPAQRYAGLRDDDLRPTDWTLMVRRSSASRDGWFWAELYTEPAMTYARTQYPNAGFGLYCLRCHASANDAQTFSSLNNIRGYPGEPIAFAVDGSSRTPPRNVTTPLASHLAQPNPEHAKNAAHPPVVSHAASAAAVQTFPPEPLDDTLAPPHPRKPAEFLASTQCMGCHGASAGPPAGPLMWLTPPPSHGSASAGGGPVGVNVSEYGEWRWSPMGLAGRDPVFFAQLESELAGIDETPARAIVGDAARTRATVKQQVVDTCMRCHGVMGKRTNELDHGPSAHFDLRWVFEGDRSKPGFRYGGLARDGISCAVCHHITQTKEETGSLALVLNARSTGLFSTGPPEKLNGPFEDRGLATHPMNDALGAKPAFSGLTKSARLCASCHSINLPVVDSGGKLAPIAQSMTHDVEQNTYVEWVNSRYQTEHAPSAGAQSCQDCHMSPGVDNARLGLRQERIRTKIALVEDQSYPKAEHLAPLDEVTVRERRTGYRRHELLGLNAFLLRAFQRNSDVLGVRLNDYMSGSATDLDDAIGNVVRQAERKTAKLDVHARIERGSAAPAAAAAPSPPTLVATVGVTNLTGHRFPTGVGFRRAWIELDVSDDAGHVVWASGRTNDNGEIVEGSRDDRVLPTEYFARGGDGRQQYQRHFDERRPVMREDQVQIFEEIVQDRSGAFTDSFVHRDRHVKDNRLLPQGWRKDGPPGIALPKNWLDATHPEGDGMASDPHYADGRGRAVTTYRIALPAGIDPARVRVSATLWYQSWEPAFRRHRTTGTSAAATRLRALLANLQLESTPLANWKLRIASASVVALPGAR